MDDGSKDGARRRRTVRRQRPQAASRCQRGTSRCPTICVAGRATSISGGCPRSSGFHRQRRTLIPSTTSRGIEPSGQSQARVVDGDLRFDDSTVAGARIAGGSTAQFSIRGQDVAYQADATVAGLDLQRVGRDFNVPALETDRYKSALNGHVQASGQGRNVKDMEVRASGTLSDSTILGGRVPQMSFDLASANDTAHVKANGAFADFDPAALSGKPAMKGSVTGSLDVDATIDGVSAGVTADNVNGTRSSRPGAVDDWGPGDRPGDSRRRLSRPLRRDPAVRHYRTGSQRESERHADARGLGRVEPGVRG